MRVLKLEHFAIVQPSFYGTDNRCLIDNLKAAGDIARGIVMIEHDADNETMRDYTDAGVCGNLLAVFKRAGIPLEEIEAYITALVEKVAPIGLHLHEAVRRVGEGGVKKGWTRVAACFTSRSRHTRCA